MRSPARGVGLPTGCQAPDVWLQGNEFRLTDLVGALPVALRKQVPARNRSGFDAESCNHCGYPPSDHIQKRPTCPPPAKSVNLNSLPWNEEPAACTRFMIELRAAMARD